MSIKEWRSGYGRRLLRGLSWRGPARGRVPRARRNSCADRRIAMAGRRRIAELSGGSPVAPTSLFGPDDDNVIPGEVVLALGADAAASITTSIPTLPRR